TIVRLEVSSEGIRPPTVTVPPGVVAGGSRGSPLAPRTREVYGFVPGRPRAVHPGAGRSVRVTYATSVTPTVQQRRASKPTRGRSVQDVPAGPGRVRRRGGERCGTDPAAEEGRWRAGRS